MMQVCIMIETMMYMITRIVRKAIKARIVRIIRMVVMEKAIAMENQGQDQGHVLNQGHNRVRNHEKHYDTPEYFQMIVKYFEKNSTCINKAMNESKLINAI